MRDVLNSFGSHSAGLLCERSHERGAVLPSRSNVDYGAADECEGCDDRAVAQAMQLLRRLSVDVFVQRSICDLFKPFVPACGTCPPGEYVRNPNRMTTNPPLLAGAENADREVAVSLRSVLFLNAITVMPIAISQSGTPIKASIAQITRSPSFQSTLAPWQALTSPRLIPNG